MPMDKMESAWVQQVDSQLAELSDRQRNMEERQARIEDNLALNSEVTIEIHGILSAAKGAFKFFSWMGRFAAWAVKIGAFCAASYATLKLAFPHIFKG